MEERFFFCNTCGNFMIAAIASGVIPHCCGSKMTLVKPDSTDGDKEKHVPEVCFVSIHCMEVKIGSKPHPMTEEHNIRFICLETTTGAVLRYLSAGDPPEVKIRFNGKPLFVYAYCNIHGLWRKDVRNMYEDCRCKEWQGM